MTKINYPILGAESMNPDIDRPTRPTLAEAIAAITKPAPYWPQDLIVKVVSLPSKMAADEQLRDAFINVIENLATNISSFSTERVLRPASVGDDVLEFSNNFNGITVHAPEYENKPVLRMLRQIQNQYMVGRSLSQLARDPFALIAFEPNKTRTDVIDAWFIPSFFISTLPAHICSKSIRSAADTVIGGEIYSFDLSGETLQSDLISDVASKMYKSMMLTPEGEQTNSEFSWPGALKQLLPNGSTDVLSNRMQGYSEVIKQAE
jgi:hypothetical protein